MGITLFLLLLLIVCQAFLTRSKIVFTSLEEQELKALAEDGDRKAGLILQLKETADKFLVTIQMGSLLVLF